MQKSIFITGASSGLGKAAAILFQSKGWNVIASMRKPEEEAELIHLKNITMIRLDVTDPAQIEETVKKLVTEHSIDIVLNNAGYGLLGPLEALSDEQIMRQINTNLLGVIRVTKAFTPYFREKKKGLFLNVTSLIGLIGYPTCSVYAATKFAVDGFSESLSYDLAQFGIGVKVIAPGGIQTDFTGRSLEGGFHAAYQQLADKVSEGYSANVVSQFSTAEHIAATIYEAATDNIEKLRYIAGADAINTYGHRQAIGAEAHVKQMKEMFSC